MYSVNIHLFTTFEYNLVNRQTDRKTHKPSENILTSSVEVINIKLLQQRINMNLFRRCIEQNKKKSKMQYLGYKV